MTGAPRLTRKGPLRPVRIVHLGPGAFFRAFNAVYTEEAGEDWGICAVSLRSTSARDALVPQGCAFTAVALAPEGPEPRVIESISNVLVAPEDPQAVVAAMAAPDVEVVSLTVTEKGYCHAPANGQLRLDDPAIARDIAGGPPATAPGLIVAALARRRSEGGAPFTVLSCDNLPHNGALTRSVTLDFARAVDPGLADWIAAEGRFPSTMVDRITPATTAEDLAALEAQTGYRDEAAVFHEPFRQWVIEHDFVAGAQPPWPAQYVADVSPHEAMKLRCLNGTHSALAYLGYLAGYETIAETVADPAFAGLCRHLWRREILPTLTPPEGEDLTAYTEALLDRYRNRAIRHRTWQIAMDGSQKLPQRILGTIADNIAAGRAWPGLALAVAGWMRYAGGVDERGRPIDLRDPLAGRLRAAAEAGRGDAAATVAAFLALREVFEPDLAGALRGPVTEAYARLVDHGAAGAVRKLVEDAG